MRQYLFSFKGRAARAQYWSVGLLLAVLLYAPIMVGMALGGKESGSAMTILGAYMIPLMIFALWVSFANTIKRFHDMNRSGWWSLMLLIPGVGTIVSLIWLGCFSGTKGPNRFGEMPV